MATVYGTTGNDTITAGLTVDDDTIQTGAGRDYVQASGGNDVYKLGYAVSLSHWRWGFDDYDTVDYRYTWSTLELADRASLYVVADLQANTVTKYIGAAAMGTDTFVGLDVLNGTHANDTLRGRDFWIYEEFRGHGGDDFIDGRGGEDWVNYSAATTAGITVDLAQGLVTSTDADVGTDTLREVECVTGTNFDDTYSAWGFGTGSVNRASYANDGNIFSPLGGNATITGNGSTILQLAYVGGSLSVNLGLQTGIGTTAEIVSLTDVAGSTGHTLGTIMASGVNSVLGGSYDDVLAGGGRVNTNGVTAASSLSGDLSFEWFRGNGGNDTIRGGTGLDRADYRMQEPMVEGIDVKLATGRVTGDMVVGTDMLRGIESVRGSYLDDVYDARGFTLRTAANASANSGDVKVLAPDSAKLASTAFNEFIASAGNDIVRGNGATRVTLDFFIETLEGVASRVVFTSATAGSADLGLTDGGLGHVDFTGTIAVRGGAGNDDMTGATGHQNLQGGYGNDTLRGGAGDDHVFGHQGGDKAAASQSTLWTDDDFLEGGTGNDLLRGDFGHDVLQGGTGADTLEGGTGNDTYYVDTTGDVVTELASGGTDTVYSSLASYVLGANVEVGRVAVGTAANLTGNALANTLAGGAGANVLTGGAGKDLLIGGGGNDRFTFRAPGDSGTTNATRDVIKDFRHGDKIVLSGIDANKATAANDAFSGTLVTSFTRAGQLRFDAHTGILWGNTDADAAAEFSIQLTGVTSLFASDLVL